MNVWTLSGLLRACAVVPALAAPAPVHIAIDRIVVHSAALEDNLEGEPADRDIVIYLPPDDARNRGKRYPVPLSTHDRISGRVGRWELWPTARYVGAMVGSGL